VVRSEREDVAAVVLASHGDVLDAYEQLGVEAWRAVDPVLLELCRLRVATLLGCEAELGWRTDAAVEAGLDEATIAELPAWPTSARFGPAERACLAFCEQFVVDVAGMDDGMVAVVAEELGPQGLRTFVTALLVIEQRQRLHLAWTRLFDAQPEPAA
jgi:AhpD family alkylhydroperoxidase